jgi:hypothetical protein
MKGERKMKVSIDNRGKFGKFEVIKTNPANGRQTPVE